MTTQYPTRHRLRHLLSLCLCLFVFTTPVHAQDLKLPVLHTLRGHHPLSFDQFKGKWVFIHYWASWCDVCLDEISTLNTFYENNQPHIALFAINMDNVPPAEQRQLSEQHHLAFPSLLADDSPSPFNGRALTALPATLIFDPAGHFRTLHYGQLSRRYLRTLLAEKVSS